MPFINNPLRRNWNQVAEDLSALQGVVDLYKKRFECAGRSEIAEKLEGVAKALALETQKVTVAHWEVERGNSVR
jgi:hypothetical protein